MNSIPTIPTADQAKVWAEAAVTSLRARVADVIQNAADEGKTSCQAFLFQWEYDLLSEEMLQKGYFFSITKKSSSHTFEVAINWK